MKRRCKRDNWEVGVLRIKGYNSGLQIEATNEGLLTKGY